MIPMENVTFFCVGMRFSIYHTPEGRQGGIYHVNAHRPEVQFIFQGETPKTISWSFEVTDKSLILRSNQSGQSLELTYQRIDYFPQ